MMEEEEFRALIHLQDAATRWLENGPFSELPAGFAKRVKFGGPDECWPMTPTSKAGYAQYGRGHRTHGERQAHRIIWRFQRGWEEIPEGYEIHHECKTRNCVNPKHLKCIKISVHRAMPKAGLDEPRSRENPRPKPERSCKRDHDPEHWWLNAQGYWICRECQKMLSRNPLYLRRDED